MTPEQKELAVLKCIIEGADYQYKIYISSPMTRLTVMQIIKQLERKRLICITKNTERKSIRKQVIKPTIKGMEFYSKYKGMIIT